MNSLSGTFSHTGDAAANRQRSSLYDVTSASLRQPLTADDIHRFAWWSLTWLGFANAPFILLWFTGGPPRSLSIWAFAVVGLFTRSWPLVVRWLLFLVILFSSAMHTISGLFNLGPHSLWHAMQFVTEMRPTVSPHYAAAIIVMLVAAVGAAVTLRRDTRFTHPLLIAAAGFSTVALTQTDERVTLSTRGFYNRFAPDGAPFSSAVSATGFASRADGTRHLMLIVFESRGKPAKGSLLESFLFRRYLNDPAIRARYTLEQGMTPFYGSTTAAEMRELCRRWGEYHPLVKQRDASCLPSELGRKGYDTVAIHGFAGTYFDRKAWYPNIGFQTMMFDKDLHKQGIPECGGVFPGACGRDIPALVADKLRSATKPTFVYWLTLNSHLPIPEGFNMHVENCERLSPQLKRDFPMLCRMKAIFDDVDKAIVAQITAADFPPTDILMVGDHAPPFFDRAQRSQFDPANVPYLYLKNRGNDTDPKLPLATSNLGLEQNRTRT